MFKVYDSEIKDFSDSERTLTALVSTATIDRSGEVLLPEGADLTAFRKNPVVLFAHNYQEPPIGKALWVKKTAQGIVSKVQFAKTQFAEEVYQLYKDGFMRAFSVGFLPKNWEDTPEEKSNDGKKPRRKYTEWEMVEYSAVPVPANPDALALALQKGYIKSDILKKEFKINDDNNIPISKSNITEAYTTISDANTVLSSFDSITDNIIEFEPQIKTEDKEIETKASIELLQSMEKEILELQNKNEDLEKEIMTLRYKLYSIVAEQTKKPKNISEMTSNEIDQKIGEVVTRVIRKVTGKITKEK
jgi:HK97 family phage prohead protease